MAKIIAETEAAMIKASGEITSEIISMEGVLVSPLAAVEIFYKVLDEMILRYTTGR